ncbi:hypothetical protein P7C70_g8933, partial [Phenoliferia sp. Uapishka_3]
MDNSSIKIDTNTNTNLTVLSQHTVLPTLPTSSFSLPSPFLLGPLDAVPIFIPISVIFIFSPPTAVSFSRLHQALAHLLDYYPHLTGRLSTNPLDNSSQIDRLGTGAALVEASCSLPLSAFSPHDTDAPLSILDLSNGGNDLLPPFGPDPAAACESPILTVQHTAFACGSVALGVRTRHTICDAHGYFMLVGHLGELYRRLREESGGTSAGGQRVQLRNPPCIMPFLADAEGVMMEEEKKQAREYVPKDFFLEREGKKEEDEEALPPTGYTVIQDSTSSIPLHPSSPPSPVTGRILHFSASSLASLKNLAISPTASPEEWISTFEALAAHLYQRIHFARLRVCSPSRSDRADSEVLPLDFLTPINLRRHLDLPENYFPNALTSLITTLPDLSTSSLPTIAQSLHHLIHPHSSLQTSQEETIKTLTWSASQPDKSKIRNHFRYSQWSLMLSSWVGFDMHDGVDFGRKPVLVGPPFTKVSLLDGLGYVLPCAPGGKGEGGVDVYLALEERTWEVLER